MDRLASVLLLAFVALFAGSLIKKQAPSFALMLSLVAGTAILLTILPDVLTLKEQMEALGSSQRDLLLTVSKITAMGFLGQWGAQLCRDANENSVADKVETALKVMILLLCLPYFSRLFALAEEIG